MPPCIASARERMRLPTTTSQMPSSVKPTRGGVARLCCWETGLWVAGGAGGLGGENDRQAHLARDLYRGVGAAVVHEDDLVHRAGRDVGERCRQCALGVVSGHDGDDATGAFRQLVGF